MFYPLLFYAFIHAFTPSRRAHIPHSLGELNDSLASQVEQPLNPMPHAPRLFSFIFSYAFLLAFLSPLLERSLRPSIRGSIQVSMRESTSPPGEDSRSHRRWRCQCDFFTFQVRILKLCDDVFRAPSSGLRTRAWNIEPNLLYFT